jgi:cytochrome c biogenesis protein CcmG, thiol:disulfide interchange protein DsbE
VKHTVSVFPICNISETFYSLNENFSPESRARRRFGQEATVRGIVVLGVVLAFLLSGERLWGDTPESIETQKSGSLLAPGQPAPDFVAHDPDGISIAMRDYRGRPVIVNFWATWCAPCRQEMRALQTVYDAHKAAGLAVLAVSQDQQDKVEVVRAYCTTLGITFPPLLDPDGHVATHYNVFFLPSTVFIHPSGMVAAVHLGAMTSAQIEQYLQAILPRPE